MHPMFSVKSVLFLVGFALAFCTNVRGQQDSTITINDLAGQTHPDTAAMLKWTVNLPDALFFTSDRLLQTYVVTTSQELIKYNADGAEQFRYNNRRLGPLKLVDASNAFNILLYYPDYQTAITLDRTLNKTGEWNLLSFGFLNVPIVATAADNQLWLYDGVEQRLKKIGPDGVLLKQSDNLLQLLGFSLQPTCLVDQGNFIFLSDPARGILVFDAQGQYHAAIPLEGVNTFQPGHTSDWIYYTQAGALWRYEQNLRSPVRLFVPEPPHPEAQYRLHPHNLFLFNGGVLKLYQHK
ncbi:MAG: hypothetical protein HUU01_04755 [Saprospiraceae bacterium]|nr:hypothetical protein [Saprospiraceae bacterium]